MTAPDPVEVSVNNQCWGSGGTAPAGAPAGAPADAIVMYDGATPKVYPWAKLPNGGWYAWDLRSVILTLAHDLLRCQPIDNGKPPTDRTTPTGLRDSINQILYLADQNNRILQALAAAGKVDITAILAE